MKPIKLNIQRFASTTILLSLHTGSANVTFQGKLECSSTASGATDNYSDVTVSLYARKQNASGATTGTSWKGNITIDGTADAFSKVSSTISVGNSWTLIRTFSKRVYHESSGAKTITVSGSITGPTGTNYANVTSSGSGTFTLDTIARYFSSTPSIWLASRTETSIVYNWSTSEPCSAISVSGSGTKSITGLNGTSGTISITGLSANTSYSHYGTFTRADSSLTTNSNTETNTTYAYPSVTSTPNFTIGNTLTIGISNPRNLSCTVHFIAANNSTLSSDTTTGTSISGYTGSTIVDNLYNSIVSSPSGQYKIRLVCSAIGLDTTVNGGRYSINSEVSKPIFSDFTFADVNATTLALTGDNTKFVDGMSTMQVNISSANKAIGYKGATITHYRISNIYYTYQDDFTASIANYQYNTITVNAIDSRSNEKPVTKNVDTLGYFKPTKTAFSYSRSSNGVGTQVTFNFEGRFWNDNFGLTTNSISASYKFKKTGASSYTTGTTTITPTISGNNYSFSGVLAGDGTDNGFSINNSYEVVITVADELNELSITYTVIEGSPAIDLYGNCLSLGEYYNETLGGRLQALGQKLIYEENDYFYFNFSEAIYVSGNSGNKYIGLSIPLNKLVADNLYARSQNARVSSAYVQQGSYTKTFNQNEISVYSCSLSSYKNCIYITLSLSNASSLYVDNICTANVTGYVKFTST